MIWEDEYRTAALRDYDQIRMQITKERRTADDATILAVGERMEGRMTEEQSGREHLLGAEGVSSPIDGVQRERRRTHIEHNLPHPPPDPSAIPRPESSVPFVLSTGQASTTQSFPSGQYSKGQLFTQGHPHTAQIFPKGQPFTAQFFPPDQPSTAQFFSSSQSTMFPEHREISAQPVG